MSFADGNFAELDGDMVAKKSQRQKWKSSLSREDCCKAYRLVANTISSLFFSPSLKDKRVPRWRRRMTGIPIIESLLRLPLLYAVIFQ